MSENNKFERQIDIFLKEQKALADGKAPKKEETETEEEESGLNIDDLLPVEFEPKSSKLALEEAGDMGDDYAFVRSNLYGLIGRSNAAVEMMLKIAVMSEHPRAMEVAASMIKTSADISKQLIDLQSKIKDKVPDPTDGAKVVNNTQNNYYQAPPATEASEIVDIEAELDRISNGKEK